MTQPGRAVAGFDSASAMVRVLGAALRGLDAPLLAQFPRRLEPAVDTALRVLQRFPEPVVQQVYARAGWLDAVRQADLRGVRSDRLADWVVGHYPRRRYPVVFLGSANGALVHLAAALGVPWLPQTLLLAVRHGGADPDDAAAAMEAMIPAGLAFVAQDPDLELHHMHDPCQDRLMVARMAYFRVKWLRLPAAYRSFLADCLEPGGTVVITDCRLRWPTTRVADRYVFQFGALGGATPQEFQQGGQRVADFLRRHGSSRDRWTPPESDGFTPEAEWGFAGELYDDVVDHGMPAQRLSFAEPEDVSGVVADLFRHWYVRQGRSADRLLVSSFLLLDPMLTMRAGLVPYWALFGTEPARNRLAGYLSGTEPYGDILLTVFPHGVDSIGLAGVDDWRELIGNDGTFLGVDPGRYPRHFRALSGFHRELARLPRRGIGPPLTWPQVEHFLSRNARSCRIRLDGQGN